MTDNLKTCVDPYLDSFAQSFAAANYTAGTIKTYRYLARTLGRLMDVAGIAPSALTPDVADRLARTAEPHPSGTMRFLGPDMNFVLNAVTMSLTDQVGVENFAGTQMAGASCGTGNPTSGGCINQTGGVIHKISTPTYAGDSTGLRENRTVDPCQLTNRRPPFFPATGRYLDNKYYEIDPVNISTWALVKSFYTRLRGRSGP